MRLMQLLSALALIAVVVSRSPDVDAADTKPAKAKAAKGKKPKKNPTSQQDAEVITALRSAFHLLDASKVSYGDHRKKGMNQIQSAVVALEKEMHKRGLKPQPHKHTAPQANQTSDALVQAGHSQVIAAGTQLTSLKATPLRTTAANHLQSAVTELTHALALAKDHAIVHELRHAYKVLDKADPIYAGHRGKAMHQINASIGDLERELHQRGMKGHHHKHYKEPVAASDLQVKHTHTVLILSQKELSTLPTTGWRTAASDHLTTAITELGKAFNVARDHVLVAELRSIHKLLNKADGIYKGHRVKSMHEINHAIGHLEKEMQAHGLKAHPHKHAWEAEAVSNWQIKHARHALTQVEAKLALHAKSDLRKKADGHIKASIQQLNLALAVVKNDAK